MATDWNADTLRRAALHGVLSDPVRLAIVDRLAWSDASPSELGGRLGLASNLLAHHVGVLVENGIVRRTRSEGDRRRIYLSMVHEALAGVVGPDGSSRNPPPRVVFVCTANSARSQLAAAVWRRQTTLPVASAGTHPAARVAPGAVRIARRHRLPSLGAPSLLADVLTAGDYVVTVCDRAHEELAVAASHWSVPDPVPRGDDDAFEAALAVIERRVGDLAPRLGAS